MYAVNIFFFFLFNYISFYCSFLQFILETLDWHFIQNDTIIIFASHSFMIIIKILHTFLLGYPSTLLCKLSDIFKGRQSQQQPQQQQQQQQQE